MSDLSVFLSLMLESLFFFPVYCHHEAPLPLSLYQSIHYVASVSRVPMYALVSGAFCFPFT